MKEIQFKDGFIPDIADIAQLYNDVGWKFYTYDLDKLLSAINKSLCVITAWEGTKLIGLVRAVGDGETILYIQDILILKEYQRRGIGKQLLDLLCDEYENVRQKVLMTDNTYETVNFYKAIGFIKVEDANMISFVMRGMEE